MSRIGKKPVQIPNGVTVTRGGNIVTVKGAKGELAWKLSNVVDVEIVGDSISVKTVVESKKTPAIWGTTRARIQGMVEGVTNGFMKKLEIEGIGYKAILEGKNLQFSLGFSHPVKIEAPDGINFKVEKNVITVSGIDKDKVGEMAARIRRLKPPEPYKGKGIKYSGEVIKRKQGKKAVATTT